MALVCPHCAAANRPNSFWCAFCHAPLRLEAHGTPSSRQTVSVHAVEESPAGEAIPSSQPQWRQELSRRVDAYRGRTVQRPEPANEPQQGLPFPVPEQPPRAMPAPARAPAAAPARAQKPKPVERRGSDRFQIFVDQPGLDFPAGTIPAPNHALVPVAALQRRVHAWLIDTGLLIACWAAFLGLLEGLGVDVVGDKLAVGVSLLILFLLYTLYFGLFTVFGGTTPGMRYAGLRVVSFDGNPPTPMQLIWRCLGYLVSGGACFLGFLSALWDEDRLCWQDRTSQTYLTAVAPAPAAQPAEVRR